LMPPEWKHSERFDGALNPSPKTTTHANPLSSLLNRKPATSNVFPHQIAGIHGIRLFVAE
jgi:hypothetical protein